MDFDREMKHFERKSRNAAATADDEAEGLEDEHAKLPGRYPGASEEQLGPRQAHVRKKIDAKRREAAIHRRRAEFASEGFLLHSPDESRDSNHMREHAKLISEAHRLGRVRHSGEKISKLPWET